MHNWGVGCGVVAIALWFPETGFLGLNLKTNSIWKRQQIAERVQNNPFDSQ